MTLETINGYQILDERQDKSIISTNEILEGELWILPEDHDEYKPLDEFSNIAIYRDEIPGHMIIRTKVFEDVFNCVYAYVHDDENGRCTVTLRDDDNDFEYFCGWEYDGLGFDNQATFLSSIGFDGLDCLTIATDEDRINDVCAIWREENYYSTTLNAPTSDLLRDNEGDILKFDSYEEAKEYINDLEEPTYILSHGEAERPAFTIVEWA